MAQPRTRRAVAEFTVRVPIHATGTLVEAATRIVERAAAVDVVDEPTVRGLEPGLNDTTVTVRARVRVVGDRGEDAAPLRRQFDECVGVADVGRVEWLDPHEEVGAVA